MNEAFLKRQGLFLIKLLGLGGILLLLHTHLVDSISTVDGFIIPLWKIYLFHTITVLAVYSIINFRFSNGQTSVFNSFILLMVAKMFLVILFLLPLFLSKSTDKVFEAINFFIPYFIFLAFEVYSINTFLAQK